MRVIHLPDGVSIDNLEWRVCHATSDYEVSEYGHVRRLTKGKGTYPGRMLSYCLHHFGYPRFKLTINGAHKTFECHRLVAKAFLPAGRPDQTEVAHKDGDPLNNHYSNLAWKTHAENEQDKFLHGTHARGTRNPQAKLTEMDVIDIRRLRSQGRTLGLIAKQFGISEGAVSDIALRQLWRHVA